MSQTYLRLTERDKLLFKRLCEFGYLSLSQISNDIFHSSSDSAAKRLRQLVSAQFIQKLRRTDEQATQIYIPSLPAVLDYVDQDIWKKGHTALHQKRKLWHRNTPIHDSLVRDFALILLNHRDDIQVELDYVLNDSEWGYGGSGRDERKVPDFVLTSNNGRKAAFELERFPKSRGIYKPVFTKALTRSARPIIYLCESLETKNKVLKVLNETLEAFQKQGQRPSSEILAVEFSELKSPGAIKSLLTKIFGPEAVVSGFLRQETLKEALGLIANDIKPLIKTGKAVPPP